MQHQQQVRGSVELSAVLADGLHERPRLRVSLYAERSQALSDFLFLGGGPPGVWGPFYLTLLGPQLKKVGGRLGLPPPLSVVKRRGPGRPLPLACTTLATRSARPSRLHHGLCA